MTRIVIYSADPWNSAISHLRIREPAHHLGWDLYPAKTGTDIDLNAIDTADYIIIQRDFPCFRQCDEIIRLAKQKEIPVIYEIDDCIFNTPEGNQQFEAYRYYLNGILKTIIAADRVIVSSKYLYNQLLSFNHNIAIFPNYLPDNIWNFKQIKKNNTPNLTIGYMGGNTHQQDLEWLAPVIINTLAQNNSLQLKIWGCQPPVDLKDHPQVQYVDIDFQDYRQFAEYFLTQSCDLFIAPLLDMPFNRGKSGIKFLEYSALGIPGVYSKIDPYIDYVTDGKNGYLASTHQEWQEKISALISDSNTRAQFAENAQKTARLQCMSDHYQEWEDAITKKPPHPEIAPPFGQNNEPLTLIQDINTVTQKAMWDIQLELSQAHLDAANLVQKVVDLENEKRGLNEHLENILNSRTWKMAKSIQTFTGKFKSNKGSIDR